MNGNKKPEHRNSYDNILYDTEIIMLNRNTEIIMTHRNTGIHCNDKPEYRNIELVMTYQNMEI